eukprot:349608-Chlamydomonas_euryale.AAC.7
MACVTDIRTRVTQLLWCSPVMQPYVSDVRTRTRIAAAAAAGRVRQDKPSNADLATSRPWRLTQQP